MAGKWHGMWGPKGWKPENQIRSVTPRSHHGTRPVGCREPSVFHLFTHFRVTLLATDVNMKQAATSQLQIIDTNFFYTGIQALVPRYDKCLKANNDYVEV
jgi:hypothetical protein